MTGRGLEMSRVLVVLAQSQWGKKKKKIKKINKNPLRIIF